MKLVSLYQRLLISEKRKEKKKLVEKCLVIKALFLFICYTSSYKRIQYREEKIIESPKFRQTLRFYKFILNILSNIRITSPCLIRNLGWGWIR